MSQPDAASPETAIRAAVIGAGGAIGRALVARLAADPRFAAVHALSRHPAAVADTPRVVPGLIDVGDPPSIEAAARAIATPLHLVIVATGQLHDGERGPERALKQLDPDWLARSFALNTIGPALVLKAFAPLLPRQGRAAIAVLSARVGSITDNRSGGWYGYRASKAALNMMVRCAAIEIGRTRPEALCVSLHPGTVDSGLSRPFQGHVAPDALFTPERSAAHLLDVLDGLTPAQSGRCFAWDGAEIPP
ncbi:SDR family NAD(P)-dependent oxidoreductase [Lichenihabitans sp. Uapishka_5]|uniref:SDR family NAD(P)-dependent oxidoreductase n=1 Tax=Lichenihabitans sp. Uapishka_5 TaxID=3037302 RepID=UPI0029E824B8|nr:SDR family NAD(P)-dependent oxidoreductase [Lichenihabitans sp. Uapishka_5]MDX7952390.1 SDR family NAD(P)-dependent oxidoreductase [Lichenihabitans sp. Uapishka_5]